MYFAALQYLHVCFVSLLRLELLFQATLKTRVIQAQHALKAVESELKQTQELEQDFETEVAQSYLEAKLTQVLCILVRR